MRVSGITLSEPQAELARRRVAEQGLSTTGSRSAWPTTGRSRDEPFDAVASIGMVEHVGSSQIDLYMQQLAAPAAARAAGC